MFENHSYFQCLTSKVYNDFYNITVCTELVRTFYFLWKKRASKQCNATINSVLHCRTKNCIIPFKLLLLFIRVVQLTQLLY